MTIQFISAEEIIYFHDKLLSVTPSVTGMSDLGRAEALLYRVLNKYEYEGVSDLWLLAAMHLLAISRGHIFNDGNKRTALFITLLCLKRNGIILAANPEFVELTVDVAAGKVSLEDIVTRLRQRGT
ncbi:type II toxin-antitoxin system death-on-curing family toxin [Escherichia coli]